MVEFLQARLFCWVTRVRNDQALGLQPRQRGSKGLSVDAEGLRERPLWRKALAGRHRPAEDLIPKQRGREIHSPLGLKLMNIHDERLLVNWSDQLTAQRTGASQRTDLHHVVARCTSYGGPWRYPSGCSM